MSLGQQILDEIIRQPMFRMECPAHPEAACLAIWNGNAAEQLEALIPSTNPGMSEPEQVRAFVTDLQKVIDRYRSEFNLTLATAIGSLEVVKLHLYHEQTNEQTNEPTDR